LAAAGIATLDIYKNEGLFERGRELSPYFLDALFSLKDVPVVADIRGYGPIKRAAAERAAAREQKLIEAWEAPAACVAQPARARASAA